MMNKMTHGSCGTSMFNWLPLWYNRDVADKENHYNDIIMSLMTSQITSFTIVDSTVY